MNPAPYNPDGLTDSQIGTAASWRLLDEDERPYDYELGTVQLWDGGWRRACGDSHFATYRTRLTRAELRAARGLEPEPQGGDEKCTQSANAVTAVDTTPTVINAASNAAPEPSEAEASNCQKCGTPLSYCGPQDPITHIPAVECPLCSLRAEVSRVTAERDEALRQAVQARTSRHAQDELTKNAFAKWQVDRDRLTAENAELKRRLLSAAGDDLCRLTQEEIKAYTSGAVQIPPKEEFIASCERFHAQIAAKDGVLTNCLTLAQMISENAALKAERDRARKERDEEEAEVATLRARVAELEKAKANLITRINVAERLLCDLPDEIEHDFITRAEDALEGTGKDFTAAMKGETP